MTTDTQLSDVLSEFARTMVTDFPIQAILDHLVQRIVDVLPITGAGVTLIAPGRNPRYIAASSTSALRFEQLQTELGQGPCLEAFHTGEAVVVPDLRLDRQFPSFGPQAIDAGLAAVFTFPLRNGNTQLGALDLYRDQPGPLDESATTAAQTLADVASAYLLNAQARTELQESSDRSRESSLHDDLTGLPNRTLLLERLAHAVRRGERTGRISAVLFADLDQFKAVNDQYGHRVGDELLVAVAKRLTGLLRPGDTLARLSGDEFVIVCEDLNERAEAEAIAARIRAAVAQTFALTDVEIEATASIGVAFAESSSQVPEQLLHDADIAMYQAKRRGGDRHQVIDMDERRTADQRTGLRQDLRTARRNGELRTEYQPIVGAVDSQIQGVEALLRWDHPSQGLISPNTLIPLAEQSGLISEIGRWVLKQACLDRHRWRSDDASAELTMSVNVSVHQLMAPGFVATVDEVLLSTRTDPRQLVLEITESVFIQDSQRATVILGALKDLGVILALDDFGTGYSSLSYLKRFPVDIVKIDRGFVADLEGDTESQAIVAAIVRLAHDLGLTVVAEGVETAWQYDEVVALGCDACQGFYLARPMAAETIDGLMTSPVPWRKMRLPHLAPRSPSDGAGEAFH